MLHITAQRHQVWPCLAISTVISDIRLQRNIVPARPQVWQNIFGCTSCKVSSHFWSPATEMQRIPSDIAGPLLAPTSNLMPPWAPFCARPGLIGTCCKLIQRTYSSGRHPLRQQPRQASVHKPLTMQNLLRFLYAVPSFFVTLGSRLYRDMVPKPKKRPLPRALSRKGGNTLTHPKPIKSTSQTPLHGICRSSTYAHLAQ